MTTYKRAVIAVLAFGLGAADVRHVAARADALPHAQLAGRYYDLQTTVLRYNMESGEFTAPARLTVTRPGLDVVADSATGNVKAGTAVLRGNVRVHDTGAAGSAQGKNAEPATLTCAQLEIDARRETYHATGRPHYESASRAADADDMLLDRKRKKLHLTGNVTVKDGDRTLTSTNVDVDLRSGDVQMRGAPVQLQAPASSAPRPTPTPKRR